MSSQHPAYTGPGQPYYHQYPYPHHSAPHSPILNAAPFQFHNPYPISPTSHGISQHSHMHLNGHQQQSTPTHLSGHGRRSYAYARSSYGTRPVTSPTYQNLPSYPPYPPYSAAYPPPHLPYPSQPWPARQVSHAQITSPVPKQLAMPPSCDAPSAYDKGPSDAIADPVETNELNEATISSPVDAGPTPQVDATVASPSQISVMIKSSSDYARGGYAIWSRRPRRPSQAPGIIISVNARPPPEVIRDALELPTPPASPLIDSPPLPEANKAVDEKSYAPEASISDQASDVDPEIQSEDLVPNTSLTAVSSLPSSSTATDATNTPSTTTPGSPASTTNTSVSLNLTPSKSSIKEPIIPQSDSSAFIDNTPSSTVDQEAPTPEPSASQSHAEVSPSALKASAPSASKKSWASLLQSSSSSSSAKQKNSLPTSSVVGVSIPASALSQSLASSGGIDPTKKAELLKLLSTQASTSMQVTSAHSYANAATTAPVLSSAATSTLIRPRGLVNTGNMCFANSVLQVLVYCPPFNKLFVNLGRVLGEGGGTGLLASVRASGNASERETPLVDATIRFLKEFGSLKPAEGVNGKKGSGGKGKEKEVTAEEDWDGESFIPAYIYDALKDKKRFDHMRGGQQEDAEEFLGFYLDTLEEELSSIINAISPSSTSRSNTKSVEEREEEAPPEEEGWLEVGKKNRSVITRTIKTTESAITRIFGGKFRSTLRAPSQKDSVIIEDWRSLRLDIQPEQIHSIQDALSHISQPQSVQVSQPTRPGVTVDASQLVLIESLPPVLVLHMKRFCYDTTVGGVVKVGKYVAFGPELDVKSDVTVTKRPPVTKYKLFGIVYHHGISASGGHYTLDVLHPNRYPSSIPGSKPREAWIRIDDELVSDVRLEDVFSPSADDTRCAYLLFYRKVGK